MNAFMPGSSGLPDATLNVSTVIAPPMKTKTARHRSPPPSRALGRDLDVVRHVLERRERRLGLGHRRRRRRAARRVDAVLHAKISPSDAGAGAASSSTTSSTVIVGAADRDFFFGFSASAPKPLPRRGARTGRRRGAVEGGGGRQKAKVPRAIILVQMRDASLPCRCAV